MTDIKALAAELISWPTMDTCRAAATALTEQAAEIAKLTDWSEGAILTISELTLKAARARREAIEECAGLIKGCHHDMGFDRDLGPLGCDLDAEDKGGCICAGIHAAIRALNTTTINPLDHEATK